MTQCTHTDQIQQVTPSAQGCEECLRMGDSWVHLRLCLSCGHMFLARSLVIMQLSCAPFVVLKDTPSDNAGSLVCCNSSKNKHAQKHFNSTQHPIVESFEPNEDWRWCYADEIYVE